MALRKHASAAARARVGVEKVNRVAVFIDGAVSIGRFPLDCYVAFIHPPAAAHRALTATELFCHLRGILNDPPIEGGVIDGHTPLAHHLFELAVADGGRQSKGLHRELARKTGRQHQWQFARW